MTLTELREKPHWSFSSLNSFINICSLQWAFRYLYKLESESTPVNLAFGSAFHATAEWIAKNRKDGEYVTADDVREIFSECWNLSCKAAEALVLDVGEWDQLNITGRNMVECLNREWVEDDITTVGKAFSVELEGASKPLIGEIDLIVKNNTRNVVLIDWKTSARKWPADKADKDLQATCFSYAWTQLTGSLPGFRYDVITKKKEPSYTQHYTFRNSDDFQRLNTLVKTVEKAVKAEAFLPNEQGFYCNGCQYASACKEWHRAQSKLISIAA